jgi:hypothetical protein
VPIDTPPARHRDPSWTGVVAGRWGRTVLVGATRPNAAADDVPGAAGGGSSASPDSAVLTANVSAAPSANTSTTIRVRERHAVGGPARTWRGARLERI